MMRSLGFLASPLAGVIDVHEPSDEKGTGKPRHHERPAVGSLPGSCKLHDDPHATAEKRNGNGFDDEATHGLGTCPAPSLPVKEAA